MRMNHLLAQLIVVCTYALPNYGQSAAIVAGGYAPFAPLTVAPGQVITIFVTGIGSQITQKVAASSFPLPAVLGGISISLNQSSGPQRPPVPLLAVFRFSTCLGASVFGSQCSNLLGITLQVPFELGPNIPGTFAAPNVAEITVSDGTNTSGAISLNPVTAQVHILRYGDTVVGNGEGSGPLVTHADGSLVSLANPAKVGEILAMYTVGLGKISPTVKTGEASPSPPIATPFPLPLIFDYRPNASPSTMLINPQTSGQQGSMVQSVSLFAGLVPGYAGLYQVNFQVPALPVPVPACGHGVDSNLTINVIGAIGSQANSFDGAGICVTTGDSPDWAELPALNAAAIALPLHLHGSFFQETFASATAPTFAATSWGCVGGFSDGIQQPLENRIPFEWPRGAVHRVVFKGFDNGAWPVVIRSCIV